MSAGNDDRRSVPSRASAGARDAALRARLRRLGATTAPASLRARIAAELDRAVARADERTTDGATPPGHSPVS